MQLGHTYECNIQLQNDTFRQYRFGIAVEMGAWKSSGITWSSCTYNRNSGIPLLSLWCLLLIFLLTLMGTIQIKIWLNRILSTYLCNFDFEIVLRVTVFIFIWNYIINDSGEHCCRKADFFVSRLAFLLILETISGLVSFCYSGMLLAYYVSQKTEF